MKHYLVTRHGQEAVNALFREMNLLIIRSLWTLAAAGKRYVESMLKIRRKKRK